MLKNRLLATGAALLAFGICISVYFGGAVVPFFIAAVAVLCILLCTVRFFRQRIGVKRILIFALIPVAGCLSCLIWRNIFVLPYSSFDGKTATITADIVQKSGGFGSTYLDVSVTGSDCGIPEGTNIRLYTESIPDCVAGDSVKVKAKLRYAGGKAYLLSSDIRLYGSASSLSVTLSDGLTASVRRGITSSADTYLSEDTAQFMKAVALNDRSGISQERYSVYQRSGTAAFFAVSGLHVSLTVMALYSLLKLLRVRKVIRAAACAVCALFFGSVVGFSPSVSRAVLMLIFTVAADAFTEESDSVTSLFFALSLLLLINPFSIASLSLQLSFASTLGIICVTDAVTARWGDPRRRVLSAVVKTVAVPAVISAGCFLFTLPITAFSFDIISLISPVSNVILGIIFSPLLISSYVFSAVAAVVPSATGFFAGITQWLINAFDSIAKALAAPPEAVVTTANAYAAAAAVIAVVTVAAVLFAAKNKQRAVIFAAGLALTAGTVVIGSRIMQSEQINETAAAYSCDYTSGGLIVGSLGETCYIDDGGYSPSSLIYGFNRKTADTSVFTSYSANTVNTASLLINSFGTKHIALPYPDAEENELYVQISVLANAAGCDIILYDDIYTALFGNADIVADTYGTAIIADKKSAYFAFADSENDSVFNSVIYATGITSYNIPAAEAAVPDGQGDASEYGKVSLYLTGDTVLLTFGDTGTEITIHER